MSKKPATKKVSAPKKPAKAVKTAAHEAPARVKPAAKKAAPRFIPEPAEPPPPKFLIQSSNAGPPRYAIAPKKLIPEEALLNLEVEVAGGIPPISYKLLTQAGVATILAKLKEKGLL